MTQPTLRPDPGWMGDPKRGASMGRPSKSTTDENASRKFTLRQVRINFQGYDSGGAYWGVGSPLYWASNQDCTIEFFFRAFDRRNAREVVEARHPGARFFR